jgi:hypothetical protein
MKAQSATEYALNYGWMLFIVAVIAVAFYSLGVFGPSVFSGRLISGFQAFGTPADWNLEGSTLKLRLVNSKFPATVTVYRITATLNDVETQHQLENLRIEPGGWRDVEFALERPPAKGEPYAISIAILHNYGGYNHTDAGTITGIAG